VAPQFSHRLLSKMIDEAMRLKEKGRWDGAHGGASEEGSLLRMGHNNVLKKFL
jgi:hypothetical protein